MTFDDLLQHYQSRAAIQRALGITPGALSQWADGGIPPGRQYQIQVITGGRLVADPWPATGHASRRG